MPMIVSLALIAACAQGPVYPDRKVRKLSPDGTKLLIAFEDPRSGGTVRQIIDVPSDRVTHTWILDRIVYKDYVAGQLHEQNSVLWAEDSRSFFEFKSTPGKNQSVKVTEIVLAKPSDPIEYPELPINGPVRPKYSLLDGRITASSHPVGERVKFWSWDPKDPVDRKQWMIQAPNGYYFAGYEPSADNSRWIWRIEPENQSKTNGESWSCSSLPFGLQLKVTRLQRTKTTKSGTGKRTIIACGPWPIDDEMP